MSKGMIHRLIDTLTSVADALNVRCSCRDAEEMAVMVFRIMSYQSRQFHTLEHVFGFLDDEADAPLTLAAVFHDVVYYQVDDGFQHDLQGIALHFVEEGPEGVRIRSDIPADNVLFHATLYIFGFKEGQVLVPFSGLNEFLSALVFVHLFGEHLTVADILAVVTCIEGSIPFRKADAEGIDPFQRLYLRLGALAKRQVFTARDSEIKDMVHRAVRFANKDVKDFSNPDPGIFLSNTWKLLPELNSPLRQNGCFTTGEYRFALFKMRKFFSMLDPAWVYHSFQGAPDPKSFELLHQAAIRNLKIAISYLDEKILAIALVEAIAIASGGDTPVAFFLGDLPREGEIPDKLDDYLPKGISPYMAKQPKTHSHTYLLLRDGRLDDTSFDLKKSPLALYLYQHIPVRKRTELRVQADRFFTGDLSPRDYLDFWPPGVRNDVIKATMKLAVTRRMELAALLV